MRNHYKLTIAVLVGFILGVCWVGIAKAETSIKNYGYFHYKNEISAKKEIMSNVSKIFDFENSANARGEKIEKGKYYIDVKYKGLRDGNGVDTDHVYLDDIIGKDGVDGRDGKNGKNGYNGKDGKDGKDGIKGDKGDRGRRGAKGDKGNDGKDGKKGDTGRKGANGNDGVDGVDGQDGIDGDKGDKGDRGKDHDPKVIEELNKRVNELNQPKYYLVPQVRLIDTKKWEVKPYAKFDVQDNFKFKEAGAKVTFKFGKSYEEKMIEKLQETVNKIEAFVSGEESANLDFAEDNYKMEVQQDGSTIITNKHKF